MYGPAVCCKRFPRSGGRGSCINVSGLELERFRAPGHHGYQRARDLNTGQASTGPFGSPVFACAGTTGPPSSSQSSRRPRRVTTTPSSIISSCGQFLCSCRGAVPSSRPALEGRRRAQGPSRLAVVARPAAGAGVARPRLDGPQHGANTQASRGATSALIQSKSRSLLRTAQAIRTSLLASAMASTL